MAISTIQPYIPQQAGALPVLARPTAAKPRVFFGGQNNNIKVMSYNCQRFYRTNSGRLYKPKHKIADLGKIIRQEDPDILCLQEVGDERMLREFNERHLNGAYTTIIAGHSSNRHEPYGSHVAILAKPGFTPRQTKNHSRVRFSLPPQIYRFRDHEYSSPRWEYVEASHPILEVGFEDPNGNPLTVVNAHFKATVTSGKRADYQTTLQQSAAQRLQEARIVARIVEQTKEESPNTDIIVAGDLNSDAERKEDAPVIRKLAGLPGNTPKENVTPPTRSQIRRAPLLREPFLTQGGYGLPDGALDTYRSGARRHKLDYMWLSPETFKRIESFRVVGKMPDRFYANASDHLPITVEYAPKPVATQFTGSRLNKIA